jgi:hypothetical protein
MKKINYLVMMILMMVFAASFLVGATDKSKQPFTTSPFGGMSYSNTADVTNVKMGTLYGVAYSIEVESVGDDTFTLTISHAPVTEQGDVTFSGKFTKFTKAITNATSNPEFAFKTLTGDSDVGLNGMFTGDMYITVSGFSGTKYSVNVIKESIETN